MKKPERLGQKLLGLSCGAVVLLVWQQLGLPCLFRTVTGIPCPGCGLTRAWLAVLGLDFSAAFAWHPMFWAVPLLAVLILWDGAVFSRKGLNILVWCLITAGFLGIYIARFFGFLGGFALI